MNGIRQSHRAAPETPFNVFSTTKPAFGVHHKEWITIRHLLTHRAGIPNLRSELIDLDRLRDPDWIVQMLCDEQSLSRAGRQLAYHAISGGFILGDVVQAVGEACSKVPPRKALGRPRLPVRTPHIQPAALRSGLRRVAV